MTLLRTCVAALVLSAALVAARAVRAGEEPPRSMPFTTNGDGLILVQATFGEVPPVQAVLDTGAGLDVLAPSVIRQVGGTPAGRFTGFRMTGERLDLDLFRVPRITVGSVTTSNVLVAGWEVLDRFKLAGIVSLNRFRDQPITLDFAARTIVVENDASLARRVASGRSVPIQLDDQRGIALDIFADFLIGGERGSCEVDTGSPGISVSTRYMAPLHIDPEGANVTKHDGPTIAGGRTVRYETSIPSVALADAPGVVSTGPAVSFSDLIYDCVVGVSFWSGRTVTVDVPHRRLLVAAGRTPHDAM